MNFINRVNPILSPNINHYWHLSGRLDDGILHEILPMDHCDLVIKIEGHFSLILDKDEVTCMDVFFQGMETKPMHLK